MNPQEQKMAQAKPARGAVDRSSKQGLWLGALLIPMLVMTSVCFGAKPTLSPSDNAFEKASFLLPSPSEVLSKLNGSKVNWASIAEEIDKNENFTLASTATENAKAAYIGIYAADGFVAIQAENQPLLEHAAKAVTDLAKELAPGVADPQIQKANKYVKEKNWAQVRVVLEQIRGHILNKLKQKKDRDAYVLASVGGWLRGLNIVSEALSANYVADQTGVFRQAELIDYLKQQLDSVGTATKQDSFVSKVLANIDEIKQICTLPRDGTVPQDKVKRLADISSELLGTLKS